MPITITQVASEVRKIPCINLVLRLIPKDVLKPIKDMLIIAKTGLQAVKIARQALGLYINIHLIPLQAKKIVLDAAIDAVRGNVKIIPENAIILCPQLGAINTLVEDSIVNQLEGVLNLTFEIDRLLSIKIDILAQIAQIDAAIIFLDDVIISVDEIIAQVEEQITP